MKTEIFLCKKICYILLVIFLLFFSAGECPFDNPTESYSENYSIGLSKENLPVKGSCKSFKTLDEATAFITSKNAEKVFEEKGELYDCEYYYSSEISAYVLVEGKKVNIHLSKGGDIKIGVPFIFGSY